MKGKKLGSTAFFLSIPMSYIGSAIVLLTLAGILQKYEFSKEIWIMFGYGLVGALGVLSTLSLRWIRTFIHESKHAVVVLFTGNRLLAMHVMKNFGHVDYLIRQDKLRFAPLISLAPYCLPLFSIPALILCLVLDGSRNDILALMLGIALGADLSTGLREIHPGQSDLKRISGGMITAIFFIAGMHLLWISLSLLWVSGGRASYVHVGYLLHNIMHLVAEKL